MAPPRQRTTAVHDDSRSEGSSTAKEVKSSSKSRKTATAATGSHALKAVSNLPSVTSAPAADIDHSSQVKINWPDMPLDLLHSYRHSYKLSCPSAFTTEYSHMILSKGIGLRSPTSIAAQRAHLARDGSADAAAASTGSNGLPRAHKHTTTHRHTPAKGPGAPPALDPKSALHRIVGQDRVSKNQLAVAVRRHFNSAGLAEQEAIARFLYKVREEGRGRQFRLRFQP
ncbi:hypothetical protein HFD88_002460 [Aspergillus terreus]|nr:hypothetical protein HFD88_002460 [Aspergillus terreus]